MKVIFMGSPAFALPTLQSLINSSSIQVNAVFTSPPKPRGRGMKVQYSPVHELASKHSITVHTPSSVRSKEVLDIINNISADVIIVCAYGLIIPKAILTAKKYGCLNIHPSDLPKYRGAAPLQRTIINGEKKTAICIMQMDAGLDTGDILMREEMLIDYTMTLQKLHDITSNRGGEMLLQTLLNIDNITPIVQSKSPIIYAEKLSKEEGEINWQKSAFEIDCMIRGMNPWPGVYFDFSYKSYQNTLKVISSEVINLSQVEREELGLIDKKPGYFLVKDFAFLCGCGNLLKISSLKPVNALKMQATDFLNGIK